ncbi:MAG TPA: non-ribosomal peptide synthetase [Candidatus Binatia bacterium]|nr:non-ribosomal peptide synthetase [Candidatus Binatia bacterium]
MTSESREIAGQLPFTEITRADLEQSIVARFEQQVSLHGSRIAIKTSNQAITYSELDRLANRTAGAILSHGKPQDKPIAIFVQDFASAIIAVLGVLKSGHIYVPLNCELPWLRLRSILEDSTAQIVLTSSQNLQLTEAVLNGHHQILNMDDFRSSASEERSSIPRAPTDLAHIIYTSGSTGIPKGVVETHRNILHHVMRVTNTARYSAEDRMTLLRAPYSGGALMNVYSALLNGSCLFPLDLKNEGMDGLIRLLREEKITVYHSSATVFRQFLRTLDPGMQFPHLRLIRLGSEHVLKQDVELYRRRSFSSTCKLVNSLNCTEANSILQNFITIDSDIIGDIVPVGYPSEDMEVLLFDESGTELDCGEIGEIGIRSRFLSPGYWRRPDLTSIFFLSHEKSDTRVFLTGDMGRMRSDGCLEYIGRKDYQVKIRGHKVNTNEIEIMLLGVACIEEVAVVAREAITGDRRLVAYIVFKSELSATVSQLRDSLSDKLPSYMIPSIFVVLTALPLAPNGKIDRRALPEPPVSRPELDIPFVMPRTLVESTLAGIWSDVLEVDHVGVNDNFFDLGGDSLLAGRIVARINQHFHANITMRDFFELPTVGELSRIVMEVS